jgi:flavin-dependent thymidylate synthase
MPKIQLINFTQSALELLIYTKSGRLNAGTKLSDIMGWPEEKKMEHLGYMMDTIKSAFEFVDYVFEIKEVSRAFTHQVVRTRPNSYQQQSQRTVDASDFGYVKSSNHPAYKRAFEIGLESYSKMLKDGVPIQDARNVLGTGIHTEILVKGNLRSFSDMAKLRLCKRTQGEYQDVFKEMKRQILEVHPWAAPLLEVHCVAYGVCAFPRYTKCPSSKVLPLIQKM